MVLLIDAYNMLKQLIHDRDINQSQRTRFVTLLKKYAQRKKHQLVIVFDGGPYQWVHKETQGNAQLVYSGARQTADDYIGYYLQQHQHKDILLVSADHELTLVACNVAIPSIDPMDFYALIQQALMPAEQEVLSDNRLVKMQDMAPHDIDALMEQASTLVPVKHVDTMVRLRSQIAAGQHRGTRIERKLLQILKKL
jgi:hypothetical protein